MINKTFNAVEVTTQVDLLKKKMEEFTFDAKKVDNKAAARRARKVSLDITKLMKDFRKNSIK